jgi:GWxTD domain-containing protein
MTGTAAMSISWTLVHSLWQGAVAGLFLLAVLVVARSPRSRYACACAALVVTVAGFALTLVIEISEAGADAAAANLAIPQLRAAPGQSGATLVRDLRLDDVLPWLAPLWILGVVVFELRSAGGWIAARRLRRRGVCNAPEFWRQRLGQLSRTMRLSRPVILLESCLAEVPVVLHDWRPAILVPAGLLSNMPAAQVEAILLHELAHIRRHDYLVNVLQTVVEGLLFYHPAVWWISSVMRTEREHCCDDLVVESSGDAGVYAAALTYLENNRLGSGSAALAATGGNLVKRVRRILGQPERSVLGPILAAAILTIVLGGALAAWQSSTAAPAPAKQTPYTKWLEEDVVYIIKDEERTAFLQIKTDGERNHFIEQFWLRRDPTPGTPRNEFKEEHYRRIAYANSHFAAGVPGWKTDRGRIYITFGPPGEIESHPSGSTGKNYPYEEWRYQSLEGIGTNVIVEFEDRSRTGDYRMTMDPNPETGKPVKSN